MLPNQMQACSACGIRIAKVTAFQGPMEIHHSARAKITRSMEDLKSTSKSIPEATSSETFNLRTSTSHCLSEATVDVFDVGQGDHDSQPQELLRILEKECPPRCIVDMRMITFRAANISGFDFATAAVHRAVRLGYCEALFALRDHGVSLESSDGGIDGFRPIHTAAHLGLNGILLTLLSMSVSVNSETDMTCPCQRLNACQVAARSGQLRTLRLLMTLGASPNLKHSLQQACFHCSVIVGLEGVPSLQLKSVLHQASAGGHSSIISFLLSEGFEVDNRVVPGGITPLMVAGLNGHIEAVSTLINAGANSQALWTGRSVMSLILSRNTKCWTEPSSLAIAEILINAGADKVTRNDKGLTLMHLIAGHSTSDVLQRLIERGMDPEIKSTGLSCYTPLSYAITRGAISNCDLLMSYGAIIDSSVFTRLAAFIRHGVNDNNLPFAPEWRQKPEWNKVPLRRSWLQALTTSMCGYSTEITSRIELFIALAEMGEVKLVNTLQPSTNIFAEDMSSREGYASDLTVLAYYLSLDERNHKEVHQTLWELRQLYSRDEWREFSDPSIEKAIASATARQDTRMLDTFEDCLRGSLRAGTGRAVVGPRLVTHALNDSSRRIV